MVDVYGSGHCPYTAELVEDLEWRGEAFAYHDVDRDREALARMLALTGGGRAVPVLVEDGVVREIGYLGRSCVVDVAPEPPEAPGG